MEERASPVRRRITTVQAVAERKRRSASELARIAGRREEITETAHGLNDIDVELLADAPDEHLDGIGVAIEVLIVKVLDQFGARDHPPGMVHQVGEEAVFEGGELDRIAVDAHAAGAGLEPYRAAC